MLKGKDGDMEQDFHTLSIIKPDGVTITHSHQESNMESHHSISLSSQDNAKQTQPLFYLIGYNVAAEGLLLMMMMVMESRTVLIQTIDIKKTIGEIVAD